MSHTNISLYQINIATWEDHYSLQTTIWPYLSLTTMYLRMLLEHVIACGWFGVSSKPAKCFICQKGRGIVPFLFGVIFTDVSGNFAGNVRVSTSIYSDWEGWIPWSIWSIKLLKHDKTESFLILTVGNWWPIPKKHIKHGKTLKRVHSCWWYQMIWFSATKRL